MLMLRNGLFGKVIITGIFLLCDLGYMMILHIEMLAPDVRTLSFNNLNIFIADKFRTKILLRFTHSKGMSDTFEWHRFYQGSCYQQ